MCMIDKRKQQSGFALLVSLIVVAAVLSIGLAILDLSIKQVRLAATTKDSEIAFHAANAGMECARFWRRSKDAEMTTGADADNISCFGASAVGVPGVPVATSGGGGGVAYSYDYEFTWNDDQSCSVISSIIIVSGADPTTVSSMPDLIPGYPDPTFVCEAFSQCTAAAVQGFNRPCGQRTNFGTIQREVLLEF